MDQALFAGANFLVNVLLARWLSPEAYGAFTVAFVLFLLVGAVHGGLFIEPMLVFGPGRFEGKIGAYVRALLRAHAVYTAAASAALAGVGVALWATGSRSLAEVFFALALAQPVVLAQWLLRRACFVVSRPDWAAGAGALYLAVLAVGAFALYAVDLLNGPTALGLMAFGSVVSGAVLVSRLGVLAAPPEPGLAAEARRAHVEYGRWAASTGALEWVQMAVPFLALPLFVGLGGSATLRALFNLAMPALQGFSALATLALPLFVRAWAAGTFRRTFRTTTGALVSLGVVYGGLILALGRPAVHLLYDGTYDASPAALLCLALLPVLAALSTISMAAIRSAERPSAAFRARLLAVSVSLTVVVALAATFGVVGALAGEALVLVVEVLALIRPVRAAARQLQTAPPDAVPA